MIPPEPQTQTEAMRFLAPTLALILVPMMGVADDAPADPASLTLRDGFDGADFAPEGGLYYRENYEQSAGRVEFQSEIVREGTGALKLSVRPLCKADAEGCSERAEIWEQTKLRVPYDQGVWYGLSMRFDDPPPTRDHRYVMMQWKREIGPEADGDFSPFLALRLRSGVMFATVETNYVEPPADAPRPEAGVCPAGWSPVWLRPETRQMRVLVAASPGWTPDLTPEFDRCTDAVVTDGPGILPVAGPEWHDYAFYTRPGPEGGGLIHVMADGAHVISVRGRIGHGDHGLGENQYFKFGPYRDGGEGDWAMFYDNFVRTPDCNAVLGGTVCDTVE